MDTRAVLGATPVAELRAQPAVAARTEKLLRLLELGLLLDLVAVACFVASSQTLLRFEDTSRVWPAVANLSAAIAAVLTTVQLWVWRQALQEWRGVKDVALASWVAPSRAAAWLGGLMGLVGPVAAAQVMLTTGRGEAAHWWAVAGGLALVAGVAFGCLHPFNPAGPRGVVPPVIVRNLRPRGVVDQADPEADTLVIGERLPTDGDAGAVSDEPGR